MGELGFSYVQFAGNRPWNESLRAKKLDRPKARIYNTCDGNEFVRRTFGACIKYKRDRTYAITFPIAYERSQEYGAIRTVKWRTFKLFDVSLCIECRSSHVPALRSKRSPYILLLHVE